MSRTHLALVLTAAVLATGAALAAGTPDQMEAAQMKMDQQMQAAMQSPGSPDERFVRIMIPHHQGAIEMSRLSLDELKDPELRRMVEKTIQENEQGIQELQAWLKKHGEP